MKKTKSQKKREKKKKEKQALKTVFAAPDDQLVIEAVNGIEIAYANRSPDSFSTKGVIEKMSDISKMAADQFNKQGRGGVVTISRINPNEGVYLSSEILFECIENMIPGALNSVKKTVTEYDPRDEFLMINIFSDKRIGITRNAFPSLEYPLLDEKS